MTRPWKVLLLISIGEFMAFLDAPVVSVAFPSIQGSFESTSPTALAWVLDAYFIGFAAVLVVAGRLSDRVGHRTMFLSGMVLFTASSLGCGLAPSAEVLIAMRALQAVAAAIVVPSGQAIMLAEFSDGERQKAIGVLAALIGLATGLAPTIGGLLVEAGGWRWVFYINLFGGVAAVAWGLRLLHADPPRVATRLPDPLGALLQAAALVLIVLGILKAEDWGGVSARTVGVFVVGVACLAWFVQRCRHHPRPVLDLEMMRNRSFAAANVGSMLFAVGLYGSMIAQVLYFTNVWGWSVLTIGLAFLPAAVVGALTGLPAGRMTERHGPRIVSIAGATCAAAGVALIALSSGLSDDYLATWFPGQLINGIGGVAALTGLVGAAMTAVPQSQYAVASGINSAARQVGGAVGVALIVAVAGSSTGAAGVSDGHTAFWIAGAAFLLAAIPAAWIAIDARGTASEPPVETPSPEAVSVGAQTAG